ncbi:MAG: T9SS type B sorting domain-containing protein [Lutibacter sp.]
MKNLIIIMLFFSTLSIVAQGEANYWFFGQNAGLNFNGGSPTPISGSLNTNEGCSTFSDKKGNLLFYSDGTTVWDKTNTPMPNGNGTLKGHSSSTQSAIIVPHPGDKNLFYIFTVGVKLDGIGEFGFHCYIVDMTKNNGLGDIVGAAIDLSDERNLSWSEKVASVKGNSCNTFWIVSLVQNTYYSYKVDINGLNPTPVTSVVNYLSGNRRGYLKISPDGKKLASATFTQGTDKDGNNVIGNGKLHLYSFNDVTGIVSNDGIEIISNAQLDGAPYGVEFSPNSLKLYTSTFDGSYNKLFQFDLESANIGTSKSLVNSQIGYRGALQLAPNGKIYATVPVSYAIGTKFLNAINAPNEQISKSNFQLNALNLGSGYAMQGLPPFIASLLLPIEITSVENNNQIITNQKVKLCVGSNYSFNTEFISGNPDYSWMLNNIEVNTTPTLTLTNIQTTDAGIYKLEVNLIDDCGFPIIYKGTFEIEVFYPPVISTTFIYDQCDIDNNSTDGITQFNLTTRINEVTQNDPNLEVFFFLTQSDLDANNAITQIDSYRSANNPNLLVKLVNNQSGCFTIGKMELNVYPTSLDAYDNYYECENDISLNNNLKSIGSGTATFDFEIKRQEILTIFSNPSIEVEFYENTNDAQLQINALQGNIDYSTKEIIVRISNKASKSCISVGKFKLIVNPLPTPKGADEEIILCVSNPRDNPQLFTSYLDGNTLNPNDTYQWYLNNNPIYGATNAFYEANAEGTYKIEVLRLYTNDLANPADDSYCKGVNSFIIVESSPPAIKINDITVEDDSNNNTISISTNNLGLGDYEYSIIDANGTIEYNYQNEPFFNNIPAGIYTLLINDKGNCGITKIEISVIGYPKFFTPNNDGFNDTWKILGVNESFYKHQTVYIFDRFGKLITKIGLNDEGWDGTFNGISLPATDYWFSVDLIDFNGNVRIKKGHFSLIRR